jgi:hypothetical protein
VDRVGNGLSEFRDITIPEDITPIQFWRDFVKAVKPTLSDPEKLQKSTLDKKSRETAYSPSARSSATATIQDLQITPL